MEISTPDVEASQTPSCVSSPEALPARDNDLQDVDMSDAGPLALYTLDDIISYTTVDNPELTPNDPGDATPRTNGSETGQPPPQSTQFDPRALLNPKSPTTKRPASSGGEPDRGRADPTIAGQVSLVERLHNVQERTASPAKRVKTEEERKKAPQWTAFSGGSALELQKANNNQNFQTGPSIDLTMSKLFAPFCGNILANSSRRRRRYANYGRQHDASHLHWQDQACICTGSLCTVSTLR